MTCSSCPLPPTHPRTCGEPTWSPCAVVGEGPASGTLPPLPVFRVSCWATNRLLKQLALVPRLVRLLGVRGRPPATPALSDTTSFSSMASVGTR